MVLMQTDAQFEDLHHWAVTTGKTRLSHTQRMEQRREILASGLEVRGIR